MADKSIMIHFAAAGGTVVKVAMATDYTGQPATFAHANDSQHTVCGKKVKSGAVILPLSFLQYDNVKPRLCSACQVKENDQTSGMVEERNLDRSGS